MPIHRVKIKDIDEAFLRKLKAEMNDEEAELAIWVPERPNESILPESAFWDILARLDWTKEGDDAAILEPAVQRLSELPVPAIIAFEDWLSEKLYQLDAQPYAENAGENAYRGPDQPFSADEFLYARCYVLARGVSFYNRVLHQPDTMPPDRTFESLLGLAAAAYQRKTSKAFAHVPVYPIETFSNAEGWNGEGLLEKILAS